MNTAKPRIAVAGHGSMGEVLVERLRREGFPVEGVFTRSALWDHRGDRTAFPEKLKWSTLVNVIEPLTKDVEVMFLAVPSGPHEKQLFDFCKNRGIYAIFFCKHLLASEYDYVRPHRHMIGANATVGGRTMSLPWLRMQYLEGKHFVLYAYLNASTNFYMHGAADGGSTRGMFEKAKALKLAEPGSEDYVSFLNAEIGSDYRYKAAIAMNDAMLGDGPFITPMSFEYAPLSERDVRFRTLPSRNDRYVIRIENLDLPDEFDRNEPGSLYAKHGNFTVSGGFVDLSRDTALSQWVKGGESNGVQIRFEGDHSYEGTMELAGLGAGPATVGAAMNDLYEYVRGRSGKLLEARWPTAA